MLVNKSGRKLVIGRLNVKNGESFPGIPFTSDERKGIEKFKKKGYIVEETAEVAALKEEKAEAAPVENVEKKAEAAPVENVEKKAEAAPVENVEKRAEAEVAAEEVAVAAKPESEVAAESEETTKFSRRSRRRRNAE